MKKALAIFCGFMFVFSFLPYMLTVAMSGQKKVKNVDLKTHHSGYQVMVNNKAVDMEQYIASVLPSVMSLSYGSEALKAQAVILRTQIYQKVKAKKTIKAEELGYNYEKETTKGKEAVTATLGKILTYQGSCIHAYYHQMSVGTTLDGQDWLGKDLPYLKAKDSFQDTESDDYIHHKEFTYGEVVKRLKDSFQMQVTTEEAKKTLMILDATKNGYVKKIRVKKETISGSAFARCFDLPSTNYYLEHYDGKFRILSLGKGSGLGLSQYGANVFAKKGWAYSRILKYYYTNIKIKKIGA